jgi:endonuclease-3
MRAIRDRLRSYYGRPRNLPHGAPLDELVLTILSQNTNDRNRDVAYMRLRRRFQSWEEVAAASVEAVEEAIRPGGISKVKSRRIQAILRAVEDASEGPSSRPLPFGVSSGLSSGFSLDWLREAPRERAIDFLTSLPGVGRKTAACVLLFSYDMPEVPVDTHVYRVASRLGLIRPRASFDKAHDELRALVDPDDCYEIHVNLIRHGRRLCTARRPLCEQCPLLSLCPHGRALVARERS